MCAESNHRGVTIARLEEIAAGPCLCDTTAKGIGCASCWAKEKLELVRD